MHGMYAGKERRNRMVALVLALVLVAGVVLALVATVVQAGAARAATTPIASRGLPAVLPAHPTLLSVVPADGAELATGPTQVQLTFSEPIPLGSRSCGCCATGPPSRPASRRSTAASSLRRSPASAAPARTGSSGRSPAAMAIDCPVSRRSR